MIATGGFGTFPQNSLTQAFQEVISENVSADFLNPFNAYMENISVPTIQPQPDSGSTPAFDLIGTLAGPANPTSEALSTLSLEEINTSIADFSASMTAEATGTLIQTETPISTLTTAPTITLLPTASETATIIPTSTFPPLIIYSTNTKKPPPPPADTATATSTSTPSPTPTIVPAGFTLSNISLNTLTNGGAVFAWTNGTFTVNYSYTVWAQGNCPGCIMQLVSGMGSAGVGTTNCAYNGQPGVSPGVSGTSSLTLTAPATPGTYDIVVQLMAQTSCANAIAAYTGASGAYQKIGQVVVHSAIVAMFNGGQYSGNLGGRAGADALCVANKPVSIGNTNVRAFISISSTDTIANMPSLVPPMNNNIPIVYQGGELIAKDWPDMLDGSINAALTLSGVPAGNWWSGSESDAGNALSTTANCNGFTDASSSAYGNFGNTSSSGSGWLASANSQACSNIYTLICVAGP
jgi:hypothetical protein